MFETYREQVSAAVVSETNSIRPEATIVLKSTAEFVMFFSSLGYCGQSTNNFL